MSISVSVTANPQGTLTPVATEEKYRRQVRTQLFGALTDASLPTSTPTAIATNYALAFPYGVYNVLSPCLQQIDQIAFQVDADITVYAYHYRNLSRSKGLAIIHEGHSYFNLPNQEYVIQRLLNLGWNVVLVQMPQLFAVASPPSAPDPAGILAHDSWCFTREAADAGYMRTFFKPGFYAKHYLESAFGYTKVITVGMSGGGFSTLWMAAMDPTIKYNASVAGVWDQDGFPTAARDYEQYSRDFGSIHRRPAYAFLPLENRDLMAMSADNGRMMRLAYVDNDGVFPSAGQHAIIDAYVAAADARVNGTIATTYDPGSTHQISNTTADVIISDLAAQNIVVTGPVNGGVVPAPAMVNLIAWYRGDSMSVGQLTDKSGNANHLVQAVSANQGTLVGTDPYIGQPCMAFTAGGAGDDFYLNNAIKVGGSNPPAYTEYTLFAVIKPNADPAAAAYTAICTTDATGVSTTGPRIVSLTLGAGQARFDMNNAAVYDVSHDVEWIWVLGIHTAAQKQIYVNGVLRQTTVGADSSPGLRRISVGRCLDSFAPLSGRIAEVGVLGHAMTAQEVVSFGAYINSRYGLPGGV